MVVSGGRDTSFCYDMGREGGVARRSWARNPNAMRTSATFNENRGEQYHITLPYIPERAVYS